MATVKCKGCGNKIEKEEAYLHIHITKNGKKQNHYYCNEEEFEEIEREKEYYRLSQYATDDILGRPITNNTRNKELKELHESGYSWQEIFICIEKMKQEIKDLITINQIYEDYAQIRYMMACIKNSIHDIVEDYRYKQQRDIFIKEEENKNIEIIEDNYQTNNLKAKRKKFF